MTTVSHLSHLRLNGGNVLSDSISGINYVLDETGVAFFRIFEKHGPDREGARAVSEAFGISIERAEADFRIFLQTIDQEQRAIGSVLPGQHHVVLEPTSGCNGACPHCYHSTHQQQWPRDQYERVLDQLTQAGIRSVSVTGGEVFSPHYIETFFRLVGQLKARDILVSTVSTNATFVTEAIRDRILREIPKETVFRISFDALRGELLDRVRPGYHKLADPYSPIRDIDSAGYGLVFTTNIAAQPIAGVLEIGEYLRGYQNIKTWNVRLAVPVHIENGLRPKLQKLTMLASRPDPAKPILYFQALLERHAAAPFPFEVVLGNYITTSMLKHPDVLQPVTSSHPCGSDEKLMVIKANGAVTQCPILTELEPSMTMGSLFDKDAPLQLESDYSTKLPLAALNVREMECDRCALRTVCGGGCRLYALAYDQGLKGCDLPARALLEWIRDDKANLFRQHWPAYHTRFVRLVAGP